MIVKEEISKKLPCVLFMLEAKLPFCAFYRKEKYIKPISMIQQVVCHGQLNHQRLMLSTVVFWFSIKSMQMIARHVDWIGSYFTS